jgi:lactoylglutathione lyase
MAIEMTSLSPNLMVEDVNKTLDYYTSILGFTRIANVPEEGQYVWGMVKTGNVTMMFQQTASIKEEYPQLNAYQPGGGLTFYIQVSDVKELFGSISAKVEVIKEVHQTPYGATEFSIKDCNGYILTFSNV